VAKTQGQFKDCTLSPRSLRRALVDMTSAEDQDFGTVIPYNGALYLGVPSIGAESIGAESEWKLIGI